MAARKLNTIEDLSGELINKQCYVKTKPSVMKPDIHVYNQVSLLQRCNPFYAYRFVVLPFLCV